MFVSSACRVAACHVYAQALEIQKRSIGLMLRAIRYINAMEISLILEFNSTVHHLSIPSTTLRMHQLVNPLPCQLMSMAAASIQKK